MSEMLPVPAPSVFWQRQRPAPRPSLQGDLTVDVAVVGGGVAGLSAAKALLQSGATVALLEADLCGAGASGRSSGFMTPDSELQLAQLTRRFGPQTAKQLYGAARAKVASLRADLSTFGITCDLVPADSLYVAKTEASRSGILEEHEARLALGLDSKLMGPNDLGGHHRYVAGLRYGETFALDGFALCRGLARGLETRGLKIFEGTRVESIAKGRVQTSSGAVTCRELIIATDRFTPELDIERPDVFAVQTVLALSAPLPAAQLDALFPTGPLMVWDSDLEYRYFRPTGDGRLLFGGNSLSHTYLSSSPPSAARVKALVDDVRAFVPGLGELEVQWHWPGYIGVSRDLLPIAGRYDAQRSVAICGTGLPWAALGGEVAARAALGEAEPIDAYFDPHRAFTEVELFQPLLRKPLTFALSHLQAKKSLKGTSAQIRRRKRILAGALLGLGALALLAYLRDGDE